MNLTTLVVPYVYDSLKIIGILLIHTANLVVMALNLMC